MRESVHRRRGPTRWLLITPLAGLVLIVTGVILLEAMAPELETTDFTVQDLPGLALEEDTSCVRRADEEGGAEAIREQFPPQGRISSTQVHLCPKAFDGLRVTYVGEVVGEVLPRRGGAWAQVNDDDYALRTGPLVGHRQQDGFNSGLSVWLPDGTHEQIERAGGPGHRGDVLEVQGVLLRADPDDGGGITVRADNVTVIAPTVDVEDPLHTVQAVVAGVLALLAAGAVIWSRRARQR